MIPTTNQTQQSSRNYPVATIQSQGAKPKAGRFLTTGTRRNPRNAAFQLNQTTSHCSLDWFLNSTAGHPVAILKTRSLTKSNEREYRYQQLLTQSQHNSSRDWFFNSSTGHSLTSATTARRNTSATTDFPFPPAASYSNHQIPNPTSRWLQHG
ncbi:hypothetical protein F511_21071 [Dorcoceras hygrometricum]|uniref:Uncharacterized protein n=1 Tax=Dorcoceras hygrometricum TaxID=472368 RepID=A0A2Z7CLB1_9LAMI|nr:hypothetical protein F511_21071 [Dorcoceras hygrometricum]